jgi:hypothetical protein
MTNEVTERRNLWLSWLELPWDVVREDLRNEMQRVGMSHEDLAFELRSNGYRVSHRTIGNWLGNEQVRTPTIGALQVLVGIFARVAVGDWSKGRLRSQTDMAEAIGLFGSFDWTPPHEPYHDAPGEEKQGSFAKSFEEIANSPPTGLSA